jgi:hypothetical protein
VKSRKGENEEGHHTSVIEVVSLTGATFTGRVEATLGTALGSPAELLDPQPMVEFGKKDWRGEGKRNGASQVFLEGLQFPASPQDTTQVHRFLAWRGVSLKSKTLP